LWDSVWDEVSGSADWAYAQAVETSNVGGLQALQALGTAVVLSLFTDRYCPPTHPLAYLIEAGDAMGWWGDGIDVDTSLGEAPLGSLLWLLRRAAIRSDTVMWVQSLAIDALSPMIGQASVVRVDAQAVQDGPDRIDLAVQLYGQNGSVIYAKQFTDIWNQLRQYGVGVKQSPPVAQ
jgi:phage gp46-like protein